MFCSSNTQLSVIYRATINTLNKILLATDTWIDQSSNIKQNQ